MHLRMHARFFTNVSDFNEHHRPRHDYDYDNYYDYYYDYDYDYPRRVLHLFVAAFLLDSQIFSAKDLSGAKSCTRWESSEENLREMKGQNTSLNFITSKAPTSCTNRTNLLRVFMQDAYRIFAFAVEFVSTSWLSGSSNNPTIISSKFSFTIETRQSTRRPLHK